MMDNNIEIKRKVNKLKHKIYYPRLYSAFQSTICFFYDDEENNIKPAGSGLFLKYKDNYYVITAAHILAEHYNDTFVILEDKELTLGGYLVNTPMPNSGNRKDDKIDISILKLDEKSKDELLKQFKAITEEEIELNHKLKNDGVYFSVGYPLTRTKIKWNTNEIKSIGNSFQSIPTKDFDYKKFGFNKQTTIAIEYDGKVISANNPYIHLSPDLTGISGSGLWFFKGLDEKYLIGVIIERINEVDYKCLLATKIDIVINMIRKMEK